MAGQQGKVVVVDEQGQVKGVFMSAAQYSNLTKSSQLKVQNQKRIEDAIERVNQAILRAQLEDDEIAPGRERLETFDDPNQTKIDFAKLSNVKQSQNSSEVSPSQLSSLLTKRAEQLFTSKPFGRSTGPVYDMRSEVIAPNFGQEPESEHDDEEIAPNFDDI